MDSYDELLKKAKQEDIQHTSNGIKKVNRAINSSKWKLIFSTITVILLIVPICYLLTLAYYSFGTKSTTLMDVASKTLYITEPNTTLEEMEFDLDFSLFSMNLSFDQYKQIGDQLYPAKNYVLQFVLDDLVSKETNSKLEKLYPKYPTETNQWIAHPKQLTVEFSNYDEWRILAGLPDETVVEAYISLNDLYEVEEVESAMENVHVTWTAIYTGIEDKEKLVSPIGYPVQPDQSYWSPFRDSPSHAETFLKMMKELQPFEDIAVKVSPHKNLELKERINYIENNGFETYGVVVTGPKNEIESLEKLNMVRFLKLGEVKLWNWLQ